MTPLHFYWVELTSGGEGVKIWWGGGGEESANFWLIWGNLPHPPSREYIYIYIYIMYIYMYIRIYICILYILYIIYISKRTLPTGFYMQWRSSVCITYIMCQSCHITSVIFEHFVCHRYVWHIYVVNCLFSESS